MNNHLFSKFLLIASVCNNKLGITPLLYGSLGLEILTGIDMNPEDIDILVPIEFLQERWEELKKEIENQGYIMLDLREHEFRNDQHKLAFSYIEGLEEFAGIHIHEIGDRMENAIKYKLLNLNQYYSVYSRSIKDGYRINVRNKKDKEKMEIIEGLLKVDRRSQ